MTYRKGFSIVEVCVACGIMVAGLLPVLTLMRQGNTGTMRNRSEIKAQQYVSNLVARCQLLPFADAYLKACEPCLANEGLDLNIGDLTFDVSVKDKAFNQTLEIKDFSGESADWPYDYKLIIASASWLNPGEPASRSVQLTGLMSK